MKSIGYVERWPPLGSEKREAGAGWDMKGLAEIERQQLKLEIVKLGTMKQPNKFVKKQ